MSTVQSQVLLNLAVLRENLRKMMSPEILQQFAEFLDKTSVGDGSMLERYKWFVENGENGESCKYALLAREFFLENQAESAAKAIVWLYNNWAKEYDN